MKKITTIITLLVFIFLAAICAKISEAKNADYVVSVGKTLVLDATAENVENYLWLHSNETTPVVTIDTENFTPGIYTFTVLATNEYGCETETSITVKVTTVVSIDNSFSSVVYPNPTSGTLNYDLVSLPANDYMISLYNTSGDLVFTHKEYSFDSFSTGSIDLSSVNPGIYVVQFSGTNFQSVQKIILQ